MTINNTEFEQNYQAGKQALERGQYRLSIKHLEAARESTAPTARQGGEARVWLVTAYQAANKIDEAIALAQELLTHPDTTTREQAQRILYIIKAPQLERPKEWMSEIPDLAAADRSESRYMAAKTKPGRQLAKELELEPTPVDTQDNQFIWFASILVAIIIGSLIWLGRT